VRTIAVLNQKGGVGKTTTAVNLGAGLARRGRRVLLLDLDPQGNLTDHLLAEPAPGVARKSVYDVLVEGAPVAEAVVPTSTPGLSVVPSHEDLAGAELDLASVIGREVILRDALASLPPDAYDYVLLDCPPSLGLLSLNALSAAAEVFIVLQTEFFAMRGLGYLDRTVDLVKKRINPRLEISGILPTMVDPVTRLSREVIEEVEGHYGAKVFRTRVRQSVRLAEAPGHQKHVFDYAPDSPGAEDYAALAEEVDGGTPKAALAEATTVAAPAPPAPATPTAGPVAKAPVEPPAKTPPAPTKKPAAPVAAAKPPTASAKPAPPAKPVAPPPPAKASSAPATAVRTPTPPSRPAAKPPPPAAPKAAAPAPVGEAPAPAKTSPPPAPPAKPAPKPSAPAVARAKPAPTLPAKARAPALPPPKRREALPAAKDAAASRETPPAKAVAAAKPPPAPKATVVVPPAPARAPAPVRAPAPRPPAPPAAKAPPPSAPSRRPAVPAPVLRPHARPPSVAPPAAPPPATPTTPTSNPPPQGSGARPAASPPRPPSASLRLPEPPRTAAARARAASSAAGGLGPSASARRNPTA
jgi:chromosome partitioning protein